MVVFEPAKGNFMFIMDSLDIVDANVTLGGCLGYLEKMIVRKYLDTNDPWWYFEKKNIFRDDGSTKLSRDDGHMMVLR